MVELASIKTSQHNNEKKSTNFRKTNSPPLQANEKLKKSINDQDDDRKKQSCCQSCIQKTLVFLSSNGFRHGK